MKDLDVQLKSIQTKLQVLLKQNQTLQRENAQLKKETEILQTTLKEKNNMLQNFKQQLDLLKLKSGVFKEEEKKELEKRIDMYLADVEKCLVLLNS